MAELDSKVFIYVKADKSAEYISTHVTNTSTGDPYYGKVAFIEGTNEIATRGKLFGLNNDASVLELTNYVGTMPKRSAITHEATQEDVTAGKAAAVGDTVVDEAERDYASVVEYIQEVATGAAKDTVANTKTSQDIVVAGGPLANNIAESGETWPWGIDSAGNKYIPSGTSFQEIFTKLFLAEKYGTLSGPVYSWSPSQSQPTVSISSTGSVPVGTEVTLTVTANETVTGKEPKATVSGATYGYSTDGTSKTSTSSSYTATGNAGTVSGTNTCTAVADAWNGYNVSGKYYVKVGTNTLSASQSGLSIAPADPTFTETNVYSMTNVNTVKTSEVKTINDAGWKASSAYASSKSLSSTKSATVTGYYPVYYGALTIVSGDVDATASNTFNATFILALGNTHSAAPSSTTVINTAAGATGYIIALPKGTQTSLSMLATSDKAPLGASQYFDIDIPMLNDVETVKYRVLYIVNAAANANAGEWYMTLA